MQFLWIFSKAFDSVPHSILMDKLSSCGMSGYTVCWVDSRAKIVVVNGISSGNSHHCCSLSFSSRTSPVQCIYQ